MAKEDQAGTEEPAGSKKTLFIIIGAVVAALLVIVVVVMMMGKGDKKAKKDGEEAAKPQATAEGAAAGVSTSYSLEPFIVNIYDGQELRYLKIKVDLEMANAAVKPDLDANLAAIRDAIIVVLTSKTLQDIQDVQGKNQLRDDILNAVSKVVAQGKVTKVYFTDFVVQ